MGLSGSGGSPAVAAMRRFAVRARIPAALNGLFGQQANLDGQIAEENTKAASVREEIFRELDARAKVQGEQQRFETMLEQIGIRRSEIDARLLRFKEEEGGAKEQSEKAQAELVKIREKISELASLSSAAEQRVNALQNVIHTLDRTLDADQVAYHREASRLESLKTLAEHYEGYGGGIQKVMEQMRAERQSRLELSMAAGTVTAAKRDKLEREADMLGDYQRICEKAPGSASDKFAAVETWFAESAARCKPRAAAIEEKLSCAFSFLENAFGDAQEMLVFTTELTSRQDAARFIAQYGSESYFAHNSDMILSERQSDLRRRVEELDL